MLITRIYYLPLFFLIFLNTYNLSANTKIEKKIVIAGICKNVANTVPNTIHNAESLGNRFQEYAILIYENNSTDATASLLSDWKEQNSRVNFLCEHLSPNDTPQTRTEKIAKARNMLITMLNNPKYSDYEYTLLVDLDFHTDWPIDEIIKTILSPQEWDCVAANGIKSNGECYDRYAFRNRNYPFGPELLGFAWWKHLSSSPLTLDGDEWIPVYSAFGGLAIYKTAVLKQFEYSGIVTMHMKKYYESIVKEISVDNPHLMIFRKLYNLPSNTRPDLIVFRQNTPEFGTTNVPTCCEHIALYAAMARQGYGKFFVNPKMKLYYQK